VIFARARVLKLDSAPLSRFGGKATGIVLGAAAGGADQFTYA